MKLSGKNAIKIGFRAGWAAAMIALAEKAESYGDAETGRVLRDEAMRAPDVQPMEAEKGPDGHLVPKRGELS